MTATWGLWRSKSIKAAALADMFRGHSAGYLRELARDARELAVVADMVAAEKEDLAGYAAMGDDDA